MVVECQALTFNHRRKVTGATKKHLKLCGIIVQNLRAGKYMEFWDSCISDQRGSKL
jgi:hypothetical protein